MAGQKSAPMPANASDVAENERFRERLKIAVSLHRNAAALARHIRSSESTLRQWLNGNSEPTRNNLVDFARAAGVSVGWLAAGEGPMRPGDVDIGGTDQAEFVRIPRYEIEASAGSGAFADREHAVDYMAFRAEWIRRVIGADPAQLVLITAVGDSMEPTIRSGDLLLVDISVTRVQDDAIYIVVNRDLLVVKRLQAFFSGVVTIKSDNPAYVEETLTRQDADQLRVAGRVRWISRLI